MNIKNTPWHITSSFQSCFWTSDGFSQGSQPPVAVALRGGDLFFSSAAAANQRDCAAGALLLLLERGRGEPVSDLLPLRLGLGRVAVRRAAAGDAV